MVKWAPEGDHFNMNTKHLRDQHVEILGVVGEIAAILKGGEAAIAAQGTLVRQKLVSLTGKVTTHLAAEDKGLYPGLISRAGSPEAKIATDFATEMGSLAGAYKEFVGRWPNGEAIAAAPLKFSNECQSIAKTLGQRIEREEKDLYPLLDALAG